MADSETKVPDGEKPYDPEDSGNLTNLSVDVSLPVDSVISPQKGDGLSASVSSSGTPSPGDSTPVITVHDSLPMANGTDHIPTLRIKESQDSDDLVHHHRKMASQTVRSTQETPSRNIMQIFLESMDGEKINLLVDSRDTIKNLKSKIHEKKGIPQNHQCIMFAGKQLQDGQRLSEYNNQKESIVCLDLRLRCSMLIYIDTVDHRSFSIEVWPSTTIENIKSEIQEREGIPPEEQCLIFAFKQLEDDKTLSYYKIQEFSNLLLAQYFIPHEC